MQRRTLLTLTAGGAASLAGCPGVLSGGSGDEGGTDPAETETPGPADISASLSVPGTATVGDTVTVTVEVENSGGKPGSFDGTLEVTEGNLEFSENVSVSEVQPGETVSQEYSVTFQYGDSYSFGLESPDVDGASTATVDVAPQQVAVGDRFNLSEDLAATVTDVSLTTMVRYEAYRSSEYGLFSTGRDVSAVLPAPTGKTLAFVEFDLENTGTSATTFDPTRFSMQNGELYPPSMANKLTRDGQSLAEEVTLEPSETLSGYLFASANTETLRSDGLTLEIQRDSSETPPEQRLSYAPDLVPRPEFEVVSLQSPSEMPTNEKYDVNITVRNTGETAGTLKGVFQWKYLEASSYDDPQWMDDTLASPKEPTVQIPAGESRDITITTSSEGDGKFAYRLAPLDDTTTTTTFN